MMWWLIGIGVVVAIAIVYRLMTIAAAAILSRDVDEYEEF